MKKGQAIGQIFTYIIAIIITAIILGYGYNSIVSIKQKSEQVSYIKFKNDLQNEIKKISFDFGSVKKVSFSLPKNYKQVCFVETPPDEDTPIPITNPKYPIIVDSSKSGVKKNVFLVENIAKDSFYIGKIVLPEDLFCVNTINGRIQLKLEGMGDHAKIS